MLSPVDVDLPLPKLLGVRVERSGPIDDVFLRLPEGMTVLYGRNGAGKTHLLRAIESIWLNRGGPAELIYEWPLPEWLATGRRPDSGDADESHGQRGIGARPDVKDWEALPGNPWYAVESELDYSMDFIDDVSRLGEASAALDRVLPLSHCSFEPARRLARQIAVNLSIERLHDDESAATVAAVCDEIVGRARFCYSGKTSKPVVVHDTDSPLLQQLIRAIRDEGRRDDHDIWDLQASERLDLGKAGWLVPQVPENEEWHTEVGGLPAAYPVWYGDVRSESLRPTPPPAQLVTEIGDDLVELTIRALEDGLGPTDQQDEDEEDQPGEPAAGAR